VGETPGSIGQTKSTVYHRRVMACLMLSVYLWILEQTNDVVNNITFLYRLNPTTYSMFDNFGETSYLVAIALAAAVNRERRPNDPYRVGRCYNYGTGCWNIESTRCVARR